MLLSDRERVRAFNVSSLEVLKVAKLGV